LIIHVNDDIAFKSISMPIGLISVTLRDPWLRALAATGSLPPGSYNGYENGIIFSGAYGSYKEVIKDGNEEGMRFFLELDPDYFEKLAKTLSITPKTAAYVAKTSQEIRQTRVQTKLITMIRGKRKL
jgi:hypothetical protein